MAPITCLLGIVKRAGIQGSMGTCNATLRQLATKSGTYIDEIVRDYGSGLKTKSEIFGNTIRNTGTDGTVTSFIKDYFRGTVVTEANGASRIDSASLWDKIRDIAYKGF